MNIFIIGLPRTGTNYVEHVCRSALPSVTFRNKLMDKKRLMSKHDCIGSYKYLKEACIPQELFLIVTKNPYMWVESICFRDEGLYLAKTVNTEKDDSNECANRTLGDKGYNLKRILDIYREYYLNWIYKKDTIVCKYESFLHMNSFNSEMDRLEKTTGTKGNKSNFKLPSKPVAHSPNFTVKDFNYYRNESPKLLSKSDIEDINEILGKGFIDKLGYKVIE